MLASKLPGSGESRLKDVTSFPLSTNRFYNLILLGPKIRLQKAANRFLVWFVPALFFTECNAYWLTSASATVLFACTWLMLSPGLILSRSMVSDLLAILEGAWQLYTGQIAHVDFHTAVGTLPFAITALAFIVVGVKPLAFVVGECLSAAVFMVISIVVVKDRLPALPAFLFIAMCVVIPLVPGGIIVWDYPSVFTFAMGYNRFGWTALSILYLLLFIEPRESRDHRWIDLGAGSILMLALFYLKITYLFVAICATCLALLTSRHIRQNWPLWCGMLLGVLVLVFSPQNGDYRADILSAAGHIRSDLVGLVKLAVRVGAEQMWVAGEVIILFYFWRQRYVPFGDVLFGLYVWISGLFLLSQNAQFITIPLYAVLALLFYMRVAHRLRAAAPPRDSTLVSCTMICVLLPLLLVCLPLCPP